MKPRPAFAPWTSLQPCAYSKGFSASPAPARATVNALHGHLAGSFRLRLGDYRVLFTLQDERLSLRDD